MRVLRKTVTTTLAGLVVAAMVTNPLPGLASPIGQAPPVELPVPPGTVFSGTTAVNNAGTIAGVIGFSDRATHPVTWDSYGRITLLPEPPGVDLMTSGIDERGYVYGYHFDGDWSAVLWDPDGRLVDLSPLAPGPTWVTGGNAAGTFVGSSTGQDGRQHAVTWDRRGHVTDLGMLPGATGSAAEGINDAGVVVGLSETGRGTASAVLWDRHGRIHQLAPTGAPYDGAGAITNAGVILGVAAGPGIADHSAVRWDRNGRLTQLTGPPGTTSVYPTGLNQRGHIAGTANFGTGYPYTRGARWDRPDRPVELVGLSESDNSEVRAMNEHDGTVGISTNQTTSRAVYWDRAGRTHALPSSPGSTQADTRDINDHGVVIGSCRNPETGEWWAVRWRVG